MKLLNNVNYYIIPFLVALFNILIIVTPNLVISASKDGLLLWFNTILPSILPFLIGTNLLIQLGFIDFLGNLLEPFMKKLFNVSGCGAFALVLGMFSGYPIGAEITASLREKDKISQYEAQRLISFTNNSGPLFIIGTIGIGMFSNIKIGYLILFIHYISAITVGIIFRFYKFSEKVDPPLAKVSIKNAFIKLKISRLKTNKRLGSILSDSIKNSLETICMIGGFVIFFSVISALLKQSNIFDVIGKIIFPEGVRSLSNGFFIGSIEITNGINILSSISTSSSVIACIVLVSFSGLSIIAQTASVIKKSDIKISIYIFSKILHSFFALIYGIICIPIINNFLKNNTALAFSNFNKISISSSSSHFVYAIFVLIIIAMLCIYFTKRKKYNFNYKK